LIFRINRALSDKYGEYLATGRLRGVPMKV
jgi:hypothetical protein